VLCIHYAATRTGQGSGFTASSLVVLREITGIAASAREVDVEAGQALATEGELGHALFAIESGTAEVSADGETRATLGPGDVFGEIAVMASGRRTASVVATSPMRLVAFFKRDVWGLEQQCPEVAERLRTLAVDHRQPRQDPV
jgi:CRP-like cAMP-binding protein